MSISLLLEMAVSGDPDRLAIVSDRERVTFADLLGQVGALAEAILASPAPAGPVALLLLAMSVASWTVIFYKAWLLHRVSADVSNGKAAFWQARDVAQGLQARCQTQ